MNGYELSRVWFDWCFVNPEKIKPNHSALYFFCIEHCNRLGWKDKFGLPTTMAMEALGIKSYNTYKDTLNDLIEFGFIKLVQKSQNQYSANIIALSNFNKAVNKALDKALIKHTSKQSESTRQSTDSIDKPLTINNEPLTINNEDAFAFEDLPLIDEDLKQKKSDLINALVVHFGFSEMRFANNKRAIFDFVHSQLPLDEDLEHFQKQFKNYHLYKSASKETLHNFTGFLGTQAMQFKNSSWNSENWEEKLSKIKSDPNRLTKFERAKTSYDNAINPYAENE